MNMFPSGLIPLIIGVVCIAFHKQLGRGAREYQRRAWGTEYGERSFTIPYLLVGVAFVVIGILMLSGVIRKQ
jgi:hypothetical protein